MNRSSSHASHFLTQRRGKDFSVDYALEHVGRMDGETIGYAERGFERRYVWNREIVRTILVNVIANIIANDYDFYFIYFILFILLVWLLFIYLILIVVHFIELPLR